MVIMKFGGTSVEDARAMENVIAIVSRERHRQPVVVLSAIAGATNTLLRSAQIALDGNLEKAHAELHALLERHVSLLENLVENRAEIQQLILAIRKRFDDLKTLCQGIAILGELTNRSLDAIASVGEQLSTLILARTMAERGIDVELVDARSFILTDDRSAAAAPLFDRIAQEARLRVLPHIQAGKIVVTQGFIGSTTKGITTTLGRGGSDYSAAIIGAALDAEEIQIWTDVDGVLTADPRIAPAAEAKGHFLPRGIGARLLRCEGASSKHHPPSRRKKHPRDRAELEAPSIDRHADCGKPTEVECGGKIHRIENRDHGHQHSIVPNAHGVWVSLLDFRCVSKTQDGCRSCQHIRGGCIIDY